MTAEEVARFFRVSRWTIYRLIASGDLKGFRVGRQWRVSPESVHAMSESQVAA